jgi:hypothetical protein
MAPAYAATPGQSAAPAATSAAAGPDTANGARVQPGGIGHLIGPHTTHPGARNATTNSANWSGYAATSGNGSFTSVSSSWVEPTGKCSSGNQYSSFWVGLDGYSSSSVEQTGSEVDCSGRTPQYYSWYEMYPAYPVNFSNTVRPGDHFTGSVRYTGGSKFTLKLSDTTEGWSQTVTKHLSGAARSSAEVIVEAPYIAGGYAPLTDFGQVGFSRSTANGLTLGNFGPVGVNMVSVNGVAEGRVSPLYGGSFTATWLSSGNGRRGGSRESTRESTRAVVPRP